MRVQFWNGSSMNFESGITRRRKSHTRTTTKVALISSIQPHSPSTITTSLILMGCVRAICKPAIRVLEGRPRGHANGQAGEASRR